MVNSGRRVSISYSEAPKSKPSDPLFSRTQPCISEDEADHALFALMITDIVSQGTDLLVAGDSRPLERAFGVEAEDGIIALPGVVSRKKQVAPKLLASLS